MVLILIIKKLIIKIILKYSELSVILSKNSIGKYAKVKVILFSVYLMIIKFINIFKSRKKINKKKNKDNLLLYIILNKNYNNNFFLLLLNDKQ